MKLLFQSFLLNCCVCTTLLIAGTSGLDPSVILHPPADTWPSYHGDYSGRRHSSLTQINRSNVRNLGLAWAFQTGQEDEIKSSPLLVDGILYFTVPDNVWAVDARSGHQIWRYTYPPNKGFHIGQRGVAMYKDSLYFTTPDAHLICLDAKDGKVRWNIVIADSAKGYWTTLSPLVVRNHVIVGVSGDFDNLRGFLRSIDPDTGKTQWTWYSTPPAGTPDQPTGGMTWMTGTYDPGLNLVYWGTGNPTPVLTAKTRPGDGLYTCSIVALNPDNGKLAWAFQPSPHDTHDWDAVETPVLFEGTYRGKRRKVLAQASRNGYFFVLDRATGENLLTSRFVETDWAKGVDAKGRPIPNPAKEPQRDGALVEANMDGATNWMAPSFDPQTGLFYVNAQKAYSVWYLLLNAAGKPDGHQGGTLNDFWGTSALVALDAATGETKWTRDLGEGRNFSGVLTTAGHLLFSGDVSGNLLALDPATGDVLWHVYAGGMMNSSPMTYILGGRQYVLTAVDSVLYAWSLPQ